MLPRDNELTICFAHVAYRLHEQFSALHTGIRSFAVRDPEGLERRVGEADVLVISGLWHDGIIGRANRLRFIQAVGAGTDQFPREDLARRGMIGDISRREDELGGKVLLVVGLGQIGGRLAQLAKAFDMRVIGLRRDPSAGRGAADAVYAMVEFKSLLPQADFVALTCPLTKETEKLLDADALGRMKPSAYLVTVARGRVVDEAALIKALAARRIAGAGIDVTAEEPLAPDSRLWGMEQVLLTPHTAGETRHYEDNVIEILRDNLGRLWRGEAQLRNQVV